MRLTFGFTPCPNDAFAFHALVHGLVPAPFEVEPVLCDIEELNRRAAAAELDLSKLSFGAAAAAGDRYRLLRSGAALGRGVGPLVVAREAGSLEDAAAGRIAVPGRETTAFLLLRLAAPALGDAVELRYDRILEAVVAGEVDAGLIIHESRFTYAEHGLVAGSRRRAEAELRQRPLCTGRPPIQLLDVEQHRLDLERRGNEAVHERVERERVVRARSEAEAESHERPKNQASSGLRSSSRVNGRTCSAWPSRSETVKSSSSVSFASCSASPSS